MLGLAEDKVRKMGPWKAIEVAYAIAVREGVPVLVPIPGTRKAKIVRPPSAAVPLAVVPRRRAIVLPARQRGPMPEAATTGSRGPLPAGLVRALFVRKAKMEKMQAAVDRASDATAARGASHDMSRKIIGPAAGRLSRPAAVGAAIRQGRAAGRGAGVRGGPVSDAARRQGRSEAAGGMPFRLGGQDGGAEWFVEGGWGA